MLRPFLIFICTLFSLILFSQEKLSTRTGIVIFEASVPSFEEVKAKSNAAYCHLNTSNGELIAIIFIKSFHFKLALMEEHFNENYMESDKYPKTTLKGKIKNFETKMLTENFQTFLLKAKLDIHGVTKTMEIPLNIRKIENKIDIQSDFILNLSDFKIKVPLKILSKINNEANVNVDFTLN